MILSSKKAAKATEYNKGRGYSRPTIISIQTTVGAGADGIFGPQTANLIATWQGMSGLTPDGMFGPASHRSMFPVVEPVTTNPAVLEAEKDWRANVGEHDTSEGGGLHEIFVECGWSRRVDMSPKGKPKDWCGMAVGTWCKRAGMKPSLCNDHYSTSNVRALYTYGDEGATNRYEEVIHTSKMRKWLDRPSILAAGDASELDSLDIQPGDVCLIAAAGKTPHHITMVRYYQAPILCTIEGNASGHGPDGERRKESVVVNLRNLSEPSTRARIYGIGRLSPLDWID